VSLLDRLLVASQRTVQW